ncbi:hypothetical protein CPB84DRAFT_1752598 [Gymnopilus junonius]|uniref:Aminotransferase class I/classII large domain-containing protein n=1 Tax=Gymnopilus junonius TaxID=109634 RepID=A0A9P5NBE7_GYMJU|nr:hypothetical protein CPB84DRAFT_1752598 [Gymnopilus junonius]
MKELETLLCWTEETEQVWAQHIGQLFQDRKVPRAILLSNPQNPLGRCYLQSFLVRTLEFCEKHNLFLISDEVFVLSGHRTGIDSTPRFQSILSINPIEANGGDAFSNPVMKLALLSLAPSFWVSSLADSFFSAFFMGKRDDNLPTMVSKKDESAINSLTSSSHSLVYWAFLNDLERAFHAHLLGHGIAIQPGLPAYCQHPGWFHVTFCRKANIWMLHYFDLIML